jgi:hypothetical protein
MKFISILSCLFIAAAGLLVSACFSEPNYSETPEISEPVIFSYRDLVAQQGVGQSRRDSIVITVNFRDGDGNLGNDIPVLGADSLQYVTNGGWGNYRVTTLRLVNGKYEALQTPVNQTLYFPNLAKGKGAGPIEGTLDFSQIFPYGTSYRRYPTKFQIQIRDRFLNVSNIIETDTIVLPYTR